MPKVILWDADGVVLKRAAEYFSVRAAREHGLPLEKVTAFFKTTFRECQLGKRNLLFELDKVLKDWGWQGSADEFLAYWFSTDEVDQEVMAVVRDLQSQGVVCCLATDQEHYRAKHIREALALGQQFDRCFFSYELGFSKEDPAFFHKVLEKLGCAPEDVQFWDDDQKNVDVAKSVGIDARLYTNLAGIN